MTTPDPRRTPHPRKVEFAYDGRTTEVLVDRQPWGHVEPAGDRYHVYDGTGRKRTRDPVQASELRATVVRVVIADRKRARPAREAQS